MSLTSSGRAPDVGRAVRYTPCKDADCDVAMDTGDGHVTGTDVAQWSPSKDAAAAVNGGRLPSNRSEEFPLQSIVTNGPTSLPSATSNGNKLRSPSTTANPSLSSGERTKLLMQQTDQQQLPWQQRSPYPSPASSSSPVNGPSGRLAGERDTSLHRTSNEETGVSRKKATDEDVGKGPVMVNRKNTTTVGAAYTNRSFSDHPTLTSSTGGGVQTSRDVRKQRRKEIKQKFGDRRKSHFHVDNVTTPGTSREDNSRCHKWTFIFDPAGRLAYWWSLVVSLAFIYNLWVIIYRFAFDEIDRATNLVFWFTLDYLADLVYVLDIIFHFRTGYLDDGVLQTDLTKLRIHYMNSMTFYIDCLCLLPLDFLYLSVGFRSVFRCFRLVKIYRFWEFLDRTERHTNHPNVVRTMALLHYLFSIYHWNACIMHMIIDSVLKSSSMWPASPSNQGVFAQYLHALYWSTMALTRSVSDPPPVTSAECVFAVVQCVLGILLFAAILGHVANIVASVSAARKDFQANLDRLKTYMTLRRVPMKLQDKVIKWFDYLWLTKKSMEEDRTLGLLPDKLKAEIALHVHLDTLKRVEIFQNTDAGFLRDLVLRLKPVLFSPGDFVCTKGEVGKEMYVVSRGRLQVVGDNFKTVLATLRPGSYFGEISVLNMGNAGNRRTASVKSVGYSDLFCLSKKDLWDVLKDYPAARVKLEAIAVKRLAQFEKAPLEKIALSRSRSTPGLVESVGKIPLELMHLQRHVTSTPHSAPTVKRHDSIAEPPCSPSRGASASDSPVPATTARRTTISACLSSPAGLRAAVAPATSGLVYSATASSLTSYVTDSASTPLSPTRGDDVTPASPQRVPVYRSTYVGGGSNRFISVPVTLMQDAPPMADAAGYLATSSSGIDGQVSGVSAFVSVARPSSPGPVQWHTGDVARTTSSIPLQLVHTTGGVATVIPVTNRLPSYGAVVHPLQQQQQNTAADMGGRGGGGPVMGGTFLNVITPHHLLPHPNPHHQQQQPASCTLSPNLTISYGSMTSSPEPSAVVLMAAGSQDQLLQQEIDRLRQRLQSLEQENASLGTKLSRQQWEVDSRLSDLEMHICSCSADSTGSAGSGCGDNGTGDATSSSGHVVLKDSVKMPRFDSLP